MRENYEKSERISAGECLHTAVDTHRPPQALTTSTPQLTFHTHTQIYAGRKQPLLSALKMQCPVQRPTTYPAVTASPHRGKAAAQPGSAACYTPASLRATQGQWHRSTQPPTQGTAEGRRAPCFFVSRSDMQNFAAINHTICIKKKKKRWKCRFQRPRLTILLAPSSQKFNRFFSNTLSVEKLLFPYMSKIYKIALVCAPAPLTHAKNQVNLFCILFELFKLNLCFLIYAHLAARPVLHSSSEQKSVIWPSAYKIFQAIHPGPIPCSTNPASLLNCPLRVILLSAVK